GVLGQPAHPAADAFGHRVFSAVPVPHRSVGDAESACEPFSGDSEVFPETFEFCCGQHGPPSTCRLDIAFSFTKGKKGGRPAAVPTSPSHSSTPGDGGVGVAVCDLPGAGSLPAVLGEHAFGGGQRLVDD